MSGRLVQHYTRPSGRRALRSSSLIALGSIELVLTPLAIWFPHAMRLGWIGFVLLLAISGVTALVVARPRQRVSWPLPPSGVTISVQVGDVFSGSGDNVVVGSNDFFDTTFDGGVIDPETTQGQLLTRVFGDDQPRLDAAIAKSLAGLSPTPVHDKPFGNPDRYPIGTVARVAVGDRQFYLPAMARMSSAEPPHIQTTVEDLQVALSRTWKAVRQSGQNKALRMPVVGSGMARLGLSKTLIIQLIILSFVSAVVRDQPARSLTIYVHSKDADEVDFARVDQWLRALCAS